MEYAEFSEESNALDYLEKAVEFFHRRGKKSCRLEVGHFIPSRRLVRFHDLLSTRHRTCHPLSHTSDTWVTAIVRAPP